MDIGAMIGDLAGNIGGVIGIVSDPVGAMQAIGAGAAAIFIGIPVLGAVFKALDDAILYIDDKVIDNIPIKAVKDFFQNKLIARLKKRIKRYEELIVKISD